MVNEGDKAPEFIGSLPDGTQLRSKDYLGRHNLIVYFYPKDFTPGCTREACSFRDRRPEIAALDAEIIGISLDSSEKHGAFAREHGLTFPLVSDPDAAIAAAFGVARFGGWLPTKRVTFVIDKKGIVRRVIHSEFSIDMHIDDAIETLKKC